VLVEQIEGDGHPLPRQAAVISLGLIGDRSAVPALLRALQTAPPDVRFQAATSVAQLDSAAAQAPLQQALHDADAEVRAAAAAALGDIGDRQAAAALAGLLDDPHPEASFEAACALARLGDRRGTPLLVAGLASEERGLRAAEHLYLCPDPSASAALRRRLDRWLTPRLQKVWLAGALARLGEGRGRGQLVGRLWSRGGGGGGAGTPRGGGPGPRPACADCRGATPAGPGR
jgi:HEAT repeat protein